MIFIIVVYLLAITAACVWFVAAALLGQVTPAYEAIRVGLACAATAGIGGALYCLRAVYLSRCVRKDWSSDWYWWYFLRPLASVICGGVSCLFLKAGLLVLESKTQGGATEVGFYALAFVAGLNVDKFVQKIEGVAHAVWGIEKSRSAGSSEQRPASTPGNTGAP